MASLFLEYIADYIRTRRYARRTIDTYLYWIKFYILHSKKQHPNALGDQEVEQFLSFLIKSTQCCGKNAGNGSN